MNTRENYNDLYVFVQVAEAGSFTRAAAKLGMAQSRVSRILRNLEDRQGVTLLTRTTRKLVLTQAGERLFRTAQESFAHLDNGLNLLAHYRDTPSGTVRINASQHAIDKVLLPKLAAFARLYPDVRLELVSENRFVDIVAERFDAGVRLGGDVDEGMIAVRIQPEGDMAVVGAPEHFRRHGFPQTPQDLSAYPCIAYRFADGSLYQWEFRQQQETVRHLPQGQWAFTDSYMEAAAARAGLGLAYVPLDLVEEDIRHGRLIHVLQAYAERLPALYLYYPHRTISPALRAVVDVLRV